MISGVEVISRTPVATAPQLSPLAHFAEALPESVRGLPEYEFMAKQLEGHDVEWDPGMHGRNGDFGALRDMQPLAWSRFEYPEPGFGWTKDRLEKAPQFEKMKGTRAVKLQPTTSDVSSFLAAFHEAVHASHIRDVENYHWITDQGLGKEFTYLKGFIDHNLPTLLRTEALATYETAKLRKKINENYAEYGLEGPLEFSSYELKALEIMEDKGEANREQRLSNLMNWFGEDPAYGEQYRKRLVAVYDRLIKTRESGGMEQFHGLPINHLPAATGRPSTSNASSPGDLMWVLK